MFFSGRGAAGDDKDVQSLVSPVVSAAFIEGTSHCSHGYRKQTLSTGPIISISYKKNQLLTLS